MPEKPDERVARHIASQSLGVPVRRYENGKADAQVDAEILFSDRSAALEIVADHEPEFNAQWKALEQLGHRLPVEGLRSAYSAQLSRSARVKRVVRELPGFLRRLERDSLAGPDHDGRELPEALERIGIRMLYPLEDASSSGYVNLHAEGWGGFTSAGSMADYVERFLDDASDVPAKLAAHPTPEKHAFIWTTIGTEYGVQFQLEQRECDRLPTESPSLPEGVTHVWVAGSFTSQGVVAWFPDRGWWRPDFAWPADGEALSLPDND